MAYVYIPVKRSGINSPISTTDWDYVQDQMVLMGASITTGTGSGSVTSVGLTGISGIISIGGSPITTAGTLTLSLSTQADNLVFAGPATGSAAAPTFRLLVNDDMPIVDYLHGGTGLNGYGGAYKFIRANGTPNAYEQASITAAGSPTTNTISVTNGAGTCVLDLVPSRIVVSDLTGTLAVNHGGTGATTAAAARVVLLPSISASTATYILQINSGKTDVEWVIKPTGIASINSDTASAQTIVATQAATDFTIVTTGGVTTINIPNATATEKGLVTTGAQTFAGVKTFNAKSVFVSGATFTAAPNLSTLTDTYIIYAGTSKETVGDATFYRNRTDKYICVDEVIEEKVTTRKADTILDITHSYIRSDSSAATGADLVYTLPHLASVPKGKSYTIKDSLGTCATPNLGFKVVSQGGNYLEYVANNTIQFIITDLSCVTVKSVYDPDLGVDVWEIVSVFGTMS